MADIICVDCQRAVWECVCNEPEQIVPFETAPESCAKPTLFRGISLEERYWAKVDKRGPDECWPWTGRRNKQGYGGINLGIAGKQSPATHVALALDGRPRPGRLHALHSCDNPPCVNPAHLRWGTQVDNVADRVARGRGVREQIRGMRNGMNTEPGCRRPGEINPSHKLTSQEVLEIVADRRTQKQIACAYGVSSVTVWKIKSGRAWVHLTGLGDPKPAVPSKWRYRALPTQEVGQ